MIENCIFVKIQSNSSCSQERLNMRRLARSWLRKALLADMNSAIRSWEEMRRYGLLFALRSPRTPFLGSLAVEGTSTCGDHTTKCSRTICPESSNSLRTTRNPACHMDQLPLI